VHDDQEEVLSDEFRRDELREDFSVTTGDDTKLVLVRRARNLYYDIFKEAERFTLIFPSLYFPFPHPDSITIPIPMASALAILSQVEVWRSMAGSSLAQQQGASGQAATKPAY
jgi:hypothetical protein